MPTNKDRTEYQRQYYLQKKDELLKRAEVSRHEKKKAKDDVVINGCKVLVGQMVAWIEQNMDHEDRPEVQDAVAVLMKCLCIVNNIEVPSILNVRHSKLCKPDQGNW